MITNFKKNRKRVYHSRVSLLFFAILTLGTVIFLIISNLKINQKRQKLNAQVEILKEELQTLKQKNQELKTKIFQFTDKDFQEEEIRKQGYKKPGEEVTVILSQKKTEKEEEKQKKNFWQRFLEKLNF